MAREVESVPKRALEKWRKEKNMVPPKKREATTKDAALQLFLALAVQDVRGWLPIEDNIRAIGITEEERNEVASLVETYVQKLRV